MKHVKLFEEFVNEFKAPIIIDGKTWGTMPQNVNAAEINIIEIYIYEDSVWLRYKEKGKFYDKTFSKGSAIPNKRSDKPLYLNLNGGNYQCDSIKDEIYDKNGKIK